ncbi:FMN-binding negative transcriptional regulator [Paroceanicella profunda]|uniref:FMN-binding negative transcriptional regulator n=1 Tax=Paroceanicella profunda TaxID=2579971 RepID=A0A5B8FIM4_9RHOB|nr:FMN-binding negative transcriptional regulator [Paroceanicella profunda]QDL93248.1 FMN-binding negative transcriptional regulator [Paroceanicella profunda]
MYTPSAFAVDDRNEIFAALRAVPLASYITAHADGPQCTALPLFLEAEEGETGVLYGHFARANPHWRAEVLGDALVVFQGPDAYVSPGWYATKRETGKVVPTWNYAAVHVHGTPEYFDDPERLRSVVSRLTDRHEAGRPAPWGLGDAPADFVTSHLRGIVGLRLPISRIEGKRKMSQNRSEADRRGVAAGLSASPRETDRIVAGMIPD